MDFEIRKAFVIKEINRIYDYIIENNLFNNSIYYKKLLRKVNQNEIELNQKSKDFIFGYIGFLGEFLISNSEYVVPFYLSVQKEYIEYKNFLSSKQIEPFIINIKDDDIISNESDEINFEFESSENKRFLYFLCGKQIGCINRALKITGKNRQERFSMESFKLLKDSTFNLIEFIHNNTMDEILIKYEQFFKNEVEKNKIIKNKCKLPNLVNGWWNFNFIYSNIVNVDNKYELKLLNVGREKII